MPRASAEGLPWYLRRPELGGHSKTHALAPPPLSRQTLPKRPRSADEPKPKPERPPIPQWQRTWKIEGARTSILFFACEYHARAAAGQGRAEVLSYM